MSPFPHPPSSRSVCTAAVLNDRIRDLWQRSGGPLSPDDEAEYQRLLVEWAAASGTSVRTPA